MSNHFRLYSFAELYASYEPAESIISGILYDMDVAIFIGASGSLKSFLAQDIAFHLAAGRSAWYGRKIKSGRLVIYIAGESAAGVIKRVAGKSLDDDLEPEKLSKYLQISKMPADFFESAGTWEVIDAINEIMGSYPEDCKPKPVIIIDTVARNFGAGNESFASDMNRFVTNIDSLRYQFGATVILVHHTGLDAQDRARGSSALEAAADTTFILKKDAANILRVEQKKAKEHEPVEPFSFQPRRVELPWFDEEGNPETTLVLDPVDWTPPPKSTGLGKNQAAALSLLNELYERSRQTLTEAGLSSGSASIDLDTWKVELHEAGIVKEGNRQAFHKLKKGLIDRELIEVRGRYVFVT